MAQLQEISRRKGVLAKRELQRRDRQNDAVYPGDIGLAIIGMRGPVREAGVGPGIA
ncbi:hypothetical protein [Mesorhizobium intechi]|uniref:hypothetical protein n=1 Tax=Mesorhizobium intechi TaxID=537601 RepID=UPI00142F0F0D|nr:hypothetical protein [Mesorhizobium intechi]